MKNSVKEPLTVNLWFEKDAEEAAKFYTSIFSDGEILGTFRYGKEGQEIHGMPEGALMTIEFMAHGTKFVGLNGGPLFKFNESVSFIIKCEDQEEVDYYWNKLGEGGNPESKQCGWLKDKYGVSWQVVPKVLYKLLSDSDKTKTGKMMNALLEMEKLDIAKLEEAFNS
ncbi:VOC family protein [Flavobacterium beibuense]|uniref:3-demethylubiquinone-9 3-methyltransferase n=1 Tax=Flavobacterium beibuense TaxID=657326 RepID=A0A444W6N1_9FLAO|nr:VOC family protein [Flavobacterium beibuense]RYJ41527.1 3-demethylubiquinone-9 3-methyltransferase [Flavobacterium beibuense]